MEMSDREPTSVVKISRQFSRHEKGRLRSDSSDVKTAETYLGDDLCDMSGEKCCEDCRCNDDVTSVLSLIPSDCEICEAGEGIWNVVTAKSDGMLSRSSDIETNQQVTSPNVVDTSASVGTLTEYADDTHNNAGNNADENSHTTGGEIPATVEEILTTLRECLPSDDDEDAQEKTPMLESKTTNLEEERETNL